jgi:hypothetical protein
MGTQRPVAFISYAHSDDEDGLISRFRQDLSSAMRAYIGDDNLEIFQDRASIRWGDDWRDKIFGALDEVIVFIPIMSPRFLQSEHCREEAQEFLARESRLGRSDLVLPVRYIDYGIGRDPTADTLLQALERHQYVDWRSLRLARNSSTKRRVELDRLGQLLAAAVLRAERAASSSEADEPIYMESPPAEAGSDEDQVVGVGTGTVQPGQSEVFEVFLKEGETYMVAVLPDDDRVDLDLTVFDSQGNIVDQDVDESSDAYCQFSPTVSDLFRLQVTSARGASSYEIRVLSGNSSGAVEEGDSDSDSVAGGQIAEGEIQGFDVLLTGGIINRIWARPFDQSVDLDLQIYDQYGTLVAVDNGVEPDAVCEVTPAVTAPYRVLVSSASGGGQYSIELELVG